MDFAMNGSLPRAGAGRAGDCVIWAWDQLDRALVDQRTDPAACLPFIHPGTRFFYWELHFRERRLTGIDFLHRPPLVFHGLAGEESSQDPILGRLTGWYASSQTARRFCDPSVWLELDGPLVAARGERQQGMSICVDPGLNRRDGADVPGPTPEALVEVFTGLEQACDVTDTRAGLVNEIHRTVVAVHGKLRHVSIMRGRAGRPAKIYAAVPKTGFPALLDQIGWPGNRSQAARLAEQVCAESERVNVDLSIDGHAISPRIGFEIFSDPSPVADFRRTAATERALALGLVSPEVVEALRRWAGLFRRRFGADQWPTTVQRWFDLKFVSHGSGGLELKAYLGFRLADGIFA